MEMKQTTKDRLFLIARILVPVVLIYLLFSHLDWKTVWTTLQGYPLIYLLGAILLNIIANLLFAIRWLYFLRTVEIEISFLDVVKLVFFSLFLTNFLPTSIGGDLIKVAGVLNKDDGKKKSLKISSIIADRIFSLASKIILLPFTLILFKSILPVDFKLPWLQSLTWPAFIPEGWRAKIKKYLHTIKPWFTPKQISVVMLISWASLFCTITSYYLAISGLNRGISALDIFCITLLTYFATILPITINGIGVQEGSITYLLTLIGFSYEEGIAAALLIRLTTIAVSLVGGLWLLIGGQDLWQVMHSWNKDKLAKEMDSGQEDTDNETVG
jgi:glycosyltransferase 2 family protein